MLIGGILKRSTRADCKSAGLRLPRFESLPHHHSLLNARFGILMVRQGNCFISRTEASRAGDDGATKTLAHLGDERERGRAIYGERGTDFHVAHYTKEPRISATDANSRSPRGQNLMGGRHRRCPHRSSRPRRSQRQSRLRPSRGWRARRGSRRCARRGADHVSARRRSPR